MWGYLTFLHHILHFIDLLNFLRIVLYFVDVINFLISSFKAVLSFSFLNCNTVNFILFGLTLELEQFLFLYWGIIHGVDFYSTRLDKQLILIIFYSWLRMVLLALIVFWHKCPKHALNLWGGISYFELIRLFTVIRHNFIWKKHLTRLPR